MNSFRFLFATILAAGLLAACNDIPLVFEVRAMDSFGLKGRPISVQRTIKSNPLNRKA